MLTKRRTNAAGGPGDGPVVASRQEGGVLAVALSGNWSTRRIAAIDARMRELEGVRGVDRLEVDLSGVGRIDTAGAWIVDRLAQAYRDRKVEVVLSGADTGDEVLLEAVEPSAEAKDDDARPQELGEERAPSHPLLGLLEPRTEQVRIVNCFQ